MLIDSFVGKDYGKCTDLEGKNKTLYSKKIDEYRFYPYPMSLNFRIGHAAF